MNCHELWLTYHQNSRSGHPATAQLIELEYQNHKMNDLEDVLDHVFRQGYVEAKHRPVSYWERKDGSKIKASSSVEHLLLEGLGLCEKTAIRLVVADMPPALWFSYVYIHGTPSGHHGHVTQRVKLDNSRYKFDKLAHVTNYVFGEGYIACKYRSMVYWERPCGARVGEHVGLDQLLGSGEGLSEDRPLKLIIDCPTWSCY